MPDPELQVSLVVTLEIFCLLFYLDFGILMQVLICKMYTNKNSNILNTYQLS